MTTSFQFDAATHRYLQDGREVPHVTGILEDAGLVCYQHIPPAILERKAEIGTAAHAACHYLDDGDLDWSTVAPEVEPYVRAWEKFRKETDFVPRLIEHRGIADVDGMQYGYTLDRDGVLHGRDVLLEIKCTAAQEVSWGPQLAAYEYPLRAADSKIRRRIAVWLRPDATYRLIEFGEVRDYQVFRWALGLAMWKLSKGKATNGNGANPQS